jgi:hypothetical protein
MTQHDYTCLVCDTKNPSLAWTDTHGIAQCFTCGTPARVYHYDDDHNRIDRAPECDVRDVWVPLLRRYRADTGRKVPSGRSFPGGQEVASRADVEAFNAWCDAHRAEIDALPEEAAPAAPAPEGGDLCQ